MSLFSFVVQAADIENIRIWPEPSKVRVVLDLSAGTEFKQFILENPDRLVIDIPQGKFSADMSKLNWPAPVTSMRYAQYDKSTLRLVFDLKNKVTPQVFTLAASGPYGDRLVIDLMNAGSNSNTTVAAATPVVQKSEPRIPEKAAKKAFIVAIDAGHGGEDPGAIGPSGTHEKNIVLAISKKLAELIRKEPGMQPVLVRDADYFIPLRQRSNIARKHQADLFISIHADAFHDARANGASVYTLSQSGASSEAAHWLAEKENQSDLIGGVSLDDKDEVLASVLLDLSQTASTKASQIMGSAVLQQLGGMTRLHSKQVQHAGFAVLKSPDIPSILVETGFISNHDNEKNLRNSAYQEKIAKAILVGIKQYMRSSNQYNDLPTLQMAATSHTIQRGETLSDIAARYSISVASIRSANKLSNDNIRIGQVLQIPPK
jgi:N-acetylmuramoyl-L-alanine amidase